MDSAESEPKQGKFEGWAIVEMMGHQREAGYVTTEVYGIAVLFRVDVPEMPEQEEVLTRPEWSGREYLEVGSKVKRQKVPARSRLIAPAALYAINSATEQAVRECLAAKIERTLILLQAPERPALPADFEVFSTR